MNKDKKLTVTIIGAGLTGCFLAILLAKRGYKVDIYERYEKEEMLKDASSRSFNLTFYSFGKRVLEEAGLWDVVNTTVIHLKGILVKVIPSNYISTTSFDHAPYFTVKRASLLQKLLQEALNNPLITIHFQEALISIDRRAKKILLQNTKSNPPTGGKYTSISCDVVFGADGVNSQTRMFMQQNQEIVHKQEHSAWIYKEVQITSRAVKRLHLQQDFIYVFTREDVIVLIFPNGNLSHTALMVLPKNQHEGFPKLTNPSAIKNFITEKIPDLLPALADITISILKNPESYFVNSYTSPWYYEDFIAILGDAAHGFFPFYGHGTSAAFGDCMEMVHLVDEYKGDWERIFPIYQQRRKKHMDAIADLSKDSFLLYKRNKKADYKSIYTRLESMLHTLFPWLFSPPLFDLISQDPGHAADYVAQFKKQRKIARIFGMPLLAGAITGVFRFQEELVKLYKKYK